MLVDLRQLDGGVQQLLLERPRRVCYVIDRGLLLVGLAGERGVLVYRMTTRSTRCATIDIEV